MRTASSPYAFDSVSFTLPRQLDVVLQSGSLMWYELPHPVLSCVCRFFQTTPVDLVDAGLFKALAIAFFAEPSREVGHVLLCKQLGARNARGHILHLTERTKLFILKRSTSMGLDTRGRSTKRRFQHESPGVPAAASESEHDIFDIDSSKEVGGLSSSGKSEAGTSLAAGSPAFQHASSGVPAAPSESEHEIFYIDSSEEVGGLSSSGESES